MLVISVQTHSDIYVVTAARLMDVTIIGQAFI